MIVLYKDEPYWRQLLDQEGVTFEVGWHGQQSTPVVVLPCVPDRGDVASLRQYLENGGGLVAGAESASRLFPGLQFARKRLRYILPDASRLFTNVGIVDIEGPGWRIAGANAGLMQNGRPALLAGESGAGRFVILPFEPASVLAGRNATQRRFLSGGSRLPVETVSRVARGEVRRLVANCLRLLLWQRGLPYVHLGYTPAGATGLFGFRVDTDESGQSAMKAMEQLADERGLKFTWFVNTGARAFDPDGVRSLAANGHDVQLHCHRHRVFADFENNSANITRGVAELTKALARPVGFAAPYGSWSTGLDRAMTQTGFEYSSEFAWDYDDLPCYPIVNGRRSTVLQVPVHPICTGSLRSARADARSMESYFDAVLRSQAARGEPCLLYDHPDGAERHAEVLRHVLAEATRWFSRATTMTDYARWWQRRAQAHSSFRMMANATVIESAGYHDDVTAVAEHPHMVSACPMNDRRIEVAKMPAAPRPPTAALDLRTIDARRQSLRRTASRATRSVRKRLQEREY
jgi:hypothetical protein